MHPWITGNPDDEIPITYKELFKNEASGFELADKFRKTLNTMLFISIVRNHSDLQKAKLLYPTIELTSPIE